MRIMIFYENRLGRNDGPPLYWLNAMRDLGVEVIHLSSEELPTEKQYGKCDAYLWVDWGEDGLTDMLPYEPIKMDTLHPSIYVTSDTHLGYNYRLQKAREFDYVFCNQVRAMEEFKRDGIRNVAFLPHAAEPKAFPNYPKAIKKFDIGFVGFVTFDKRAQMLDRMFKEFPNFWYGQRLFEECAEVFRRSRIVFNTAADDDINMRCFEATATGSFLLTEFVPTIETCFEDGKHLVTYKTMDEAVEKARYYLEHAEEREAIAKAGMEHTLLHHTYQNRFREVAWKIGLGLKDSTNSRLNENSSNAVLGLM